MTFGLAILFNASTQVRTHTTPTLPYKFTRVWLNSQITPPQNHLTPPFESQRRLLERPLNEDATVMRALFTL